MRIDYTPEQRALAAELREYFAELMTPAVFSVAPDTPARRVVEEMLALHVHRMFVVDDGGFLVGDLGESVQQAAPDVVHDRDSRTSGDLGQLLQGGGAGPR